MAKLVFIGDSLTQWCDWDRRLPGHDVLNLGISGETVRELLDRRDRIRSHVTGPDYLFLMTGINDIANGNYDILPAYQEIVRNLTTWYKTAVIAVQSILPVELPWVDNNTIRNINRDLERIAHEHGARFIDTHALFLDQRGKLRAGFLTDDGVHIANKGYDAWAAAIAGFMVGIHSGEVAQH